MLSKIRFLIDVHLAWSSHKSQQLGWDKQICDWYWITQDIFRCS